jgi:NitT/TauT family transport system ATP-binding protein
MFQEYGLFPWFTVLENAALGLRIRKRSAEDAVKRAKEELARLGLGGKENRYPHEISGGERQRVALARSLALDPEVLLMDEPFSALDAVTREALQDLLYRELSARPIVTVLVTHSIEEAVYLGNRLFVIRQGSESCLREAVPFSGARDAETRRLPAYFAVCTALRRIMEERG